jgi:hypothetical protein
MMHTSLAGADVPLPGGDVAANHLPSVSPIHLSSRVIHRLQGFSVTGLTSYRGRIVYSQSIDAVFRAYRMSSGHERHGFACATPLGPLTITVFFAAPTLNRSLMAGSPPPTEPCQTDSWSFSSTSWVTTCHRADPETGPLDLTQLAAISSTPCGGGQLVAALAQSQFGKVRSLPAQWVKNASSQGVHFRPKPSTRSTCF